jgi:hypothetical protein
VDLIRRLVIDRPLLLIREVQEELNDLKAKTQKDSLRELVSIVFDAKGEFNQRLQRASEKWTRGYEYPISKYVNLLAVRRRVLRNLVHDFEKHEGRRPAGKEMIKLQRQWLAKGISQRTLSLARKGIEKRGYADETLSVEAVLRPIITGRDCFVLTADKDIFEQVYQFTVLLHDDYGSFLSAQDLTRNPDRYTHRHEIHTDFMKPGAIAIGQVRKPDYLLPRMFHTCAVCLIDVGTLEFLTWVCMREVEEMLNFQGRSADGRTADGPNGLNVHISIPTRKCRDATAHFVIGEDRILTDFQTPIGPIRLSYFDIFRVITDKALPETSGRRIWIPRRPVL